MGKNMNCLIKTLHLLSACFWLGAATSVVLLQCLMGWSEDVQLLLALNQNFSILDFALIIPGAMGSALTGYLMCRKTSWGFTRYWWILTKWFLTIALILIGITCLGPWQLKMANLSKQGDGLIADASYNVIRNHFTVIGLLQVTLLVCIITLSVLKPWGKRVLRQKEANGARTQGDVPV